VRVIRPRSTTLKKIDRARKQPYSDCMSQSQTQAAIVALMSDGRSRSSYAIADALYGGRATPPQWWRVAAEVETMAYGKRHRSNRLLNAIHDGERWQYTVLRKQ